MLMEATLSSKGQATIPKAVRERLHLKPGDRFKFFFHPDGVIILPKIPTSRLKGITSQACFPRGNRRCRRGRCHASIQAEEMIGLDTYVLLRYLAQDDPVQSARATEIVTSQLTEEEPGFVSLITILEVVWVLKSLYKRSRQEIATDIEMVLSADTIEVQNEQEVYHAVVALRNGTGTFEDALIGALGIWRGCSATLTFDEKAAQRLHGFALA